MYSHLDQSSIGRSSIVALIGAGLFSTGLFAAYILFKITQFIFSEYQAGEGAYTYLTLINQALWCLAALALAMSGLSLIISAIQRKQFDLIPGPTLYILGFSLMAIGGIALINGLMHEAILLCLTGFILMLWEWKAHVS